MSAVFQVEKQIDVWRDLSLRHRSYENVLRRNSDTGCILSAAWVVN